MWQNSITHQIDQHEQSSWEIEKVAQRVLYDSYIIIFLRCLYQNSTYTIRTPCAHVYALLRGKCCNVAWYIWTEHIKCQFLTIYQTFYRWSFICEKPRHVCKAPNLNILLCISIRVESVWRRTCGKILYNFSISILVHATEENKKKHNFFGLLYSSIHVDAAAAAAAADISMWDYRLTHGPSCWCNFSHANGIWNCQNFSLPYKVAKQILSFSQNWRRWVIIYKCVHIFLRATGSVCLSASTIIRHDALSSFIHKRNESAYIVTSLHRSSLNGNSYRGIFKHATVRQSVVLINSRIFCQRNTDKKGCAMVFGTWPKIWIHVYVGVGLYVSWEWRKEEMKNMPIRRCFTRLRLCDKCSSSGDKLNSMSMTVARFMQSDANFWICDLFEVIYLKQRSVCHI